MGNNIAIRHSLPALLMCLVVSLTAIASTASDIKHKPFILASTNPGTDMAALATTISKKLTERGFQIVGQYSPYREALVIIVTNDAVRQQAAQSTLGAFGAVQRIALTLVDNAIQVSYTNPVYMAHAYRMQSDLSDIRQQLVDTLGMQHEFGPEHGLSKTELRKYHYKFLMPYFDEPIDLVAYRDYATALEKIEAIMTTQAGGVKKIYRVDLPGKAETVIGVHLTGPNEDCSGDAYIMKRIDFKPTKSTGHLPYEIVISEGKVYALPAEFRIAINFPDLSMMGSNSFASIMCAPGYIRSALTKAVGGSEE